MQIEMKSVEVLIPYENNPRYNEDAIEKVAASIREFGFNVPIIVDKNNVIVAGHTRLEAAKQLGLDTVPTICADHLTEEQVKAFRIADNKVSEFSRWDMEKLEQELSEIDFEMSEFGFELSMDIPNYGAEEDDKDREKSISQPQLKFSSFSVPMTEKELSNLVALAEEYLADKGVMYGFVSHLLGEVEE